MDTLFEVEGDPHEYTVEAMEDAGLCCPNTAKQAIRSCEEKTR
jgi:hypothetical protein